MKFSSGLKLKLVAFFIIVAILPLLVGGIWTVIGVKKHFVNSVYVQNNLIADQLSDQVDQLIKDKVNLVKALANTPQVIKMNANELKSFLTSIKEKSPNIDVIGVINSSGMQIARSDDSKLLDLRDRSYYKDVMAGKEYAVSEVLVAGGTKKASIMVAAPIKENGVIKGVIHLTLSLSSLGDLIAGTKAGMTGYSFIVDSKGRTVAHPNQQYSVEQKDMAASPPVQEGLSGKTGSIEYSDEGKMWLASYAQTPFLNWVVVTQQTLDEATTGANNLVKNTLIVLFLGALFAVLMGVFLSNRFVKPLVTLNKEVLDISAGDLTKTFHIELNDEIGQLARSVSKMRDNLRDIVSQLLETGHQLSEFSGQLSNQAQQTSAGASETAATVGEIASTVEQVSKNIQDVSLVSEKAAQEAQDGNTSVEMLTSQMKAITATSDEVTDEINSLSGTLSEINQIVDLITSIADQTNLLALNAAIEAARAGEQGRGFAVVAEEVRKLAEQSASAAKDINQMITKVQEKSEKAVASMSAGNNQVKEGASVVEEVGSKFKIIIDSVHLLAEQVQSVAAAAEQVAAGVQNVAATTEEQTAAMEEVSAATGQLSQMAEDLNRLVKKFKI